jgi:hypothetical protein
VKAPFSCPKNSLSISVPEIRRAIHPDERRLCPRALTVYLVRIQLFACTALALDQDSRLRARHALDELPHLPDRGAVPQYLRLSLLLAVILCNIEDVAVLLGFLDDNLDLPFEKGLMR